MKLVTFQLNTTIGPVERIGALHGEGIIDLNLGYVSWLAAAGEGRAYEVAAHEMPPSMIRLLEGGGVAMDRARRTVEFVAAELSRRGRVVGPRKERIFYRRGEVRLMAPLPGPNSIRDFTCFEGHAQIMGPKHRDWYEMPVHYNGNPRSVIGPEETIPWPSYTQLLDYELEYGIYIGRQGRNIPREEAAKYIAGFTIFNDVSARDVPRGAYLAPSKMKDFCNVMGPCLVTPDEIDPADLRMVARINGEVWTDGNSGTMYWTWAELIEFASMDETLYPGDFLGSGTVDNGCGIDHGRWIKPGDVIELEVEGIGILRNRVGARPKRARSLRLREGVVR